MSIGTVTGLIFSLLNNDGYCLFDYKINGLPWSKRAASETSCGPRR